MKKKNQEDRVWREDEVAVGNHVTIVVKDEEIAEIEAENIVVIHEMTFVIDVTTVEKRDVTIVVREEETEVETEAEKIVEIGDVMVVMREDEVRVEIGDIIAKKRAKMMEYLVKITLKLV